MALAVLDALDTLREHHLAQQARQRAAQLQRAATLTPTPTPTLPLDSEAPHTAQVLEAQQEAEALLASNLVRTYSLAAPVLLHFLSSLESRGGFAAVQRGKGGPGGSGTPREPLHGSTDDPLAYLLSATLVGVYRCHQRLLDLPSRLFYSGVPLMRASSEVEDPSTVAAQGWSLLAEVGGGGEGGGSAVSLDELEAVLLAGGGGGSDGEAAKGAAASSTTASTSPSSTASTSSSSASRYPMVVLGVVGKDYVENVLTAQQFSNAEEVSAVVFACQSLMSESALQAGFAAPLHAARVLWVPSSSSEGAGRSFSYPSAPGARCLAITAEDIAVITPYRSQVLLLRAALRAANLYDVNVGTPEVLQGKERKVVILSTVLSANCGPDVLGRRQAQLRAQQRAVRELAGEGEGEGGEQEAPVSLLGSSSIMPAGLFYDPRALNVSMTRAQSLLVVVGDPQCLAMDPHLKQVLQAALNHQTFFSLSGQCLPPQWERKGALGLR